MCVLELWTLLVSKAVGRFAGLSVCVLLVQGMSQHVGEAVCTRETFNTEEQRPQVREVIRHVREHRPFEKEFVNEVSISPFLFLFFFFIFCFFSCFELLVLLQSGMPVLCNCVWQVDCKPACILVY